MKTKSKVKSACILLLLCTGILTMSGCSMGMGRETLENDVLRVGMHLDIDKMCYLSKEDNQPEGFEVELAGILADKMGMELEIVDTTEENLLKSLDGEVYDCVLLLWDSASGILYIMDIPGPTWIFPLWKKNPEQRGIPRSQPLPEKEILWQIRWKNIWKN